MKFNRQLFKEAFKMGYKKALNEMRKPEWDEEYNQGLGKKPYRFVVNGIPCGNHGDTLISAVGDRVYRKFGTNPLAALDKMLSEATPFDGVDPDELQLTDEDILNNLEVHDEEPEYIEGETLTFPISEIGVDDDRWISFPWNW